MGRPPWAHFRDPQLHPRHQPAYTVSVIRLLLLGALLTAGCGGGDRSDPTDGASSGAADNAGAVGDAGSGQGEVGDEGPGEVGGEGSGEGPGEVGGEGSGEGPGEVGGEAGGEGEGEVGGEGEGEVGGEGPGSGAGDPGEGEGEGEGGAAVGEGEGEPAPRELVHASPPSVGIEPAAFTAWANDGTQRGPADLHGRPTVMWFFPFAGTPG